MISPAQEQRHRKGLARPKANIVAAGWHRQRMAAIGPSNYLECSPDNDANNDGLDAMEGDGKDDGSQMRDVYDDNEFVSDAGGGIDGDKDNNHILQEVTASVRCGAWPKPQVDEDVSDEKEEDRDRPDVDDDWESQPDDSDNEDEVNGLSAWDALGENFARELSDVGQYIPLALLTFTLLSPS